MINVNDYTDLSDLHGAVLRWREDNHSQYNRNPSVQLKVWGEKEYYGAHIHWHPFDKEWIIGADFHGFDNQGRPYMDHLGARRYKRLETLLIQIRAWASAGPARIYLSTSRWNKINNN